MRPESALFLPMLIKSLQLSSSTSCCSPKESIVLYPLSNVSSSSSERHTNLSSTMTVCRFWVGKITFSFVSSSIGSIAFWYSSWNLKLIQYCLHKIDFVYFSFDQGIIIKLSYFWCILLIQPKYCKNLFDNLIKLKKFSYIFKLIYLKKHLTQFLQFCTFLLCVFSTVTNKVNYCDWLFWLNKRYLK